VHSKSVSNDASILIARDLRTKNLGPGPKNIEKSRSGSSTFKGTRVDLNWDQDDRDQDRKMEWGKFVGSDTSWIIFDAHLKNFRPSCSVFLQLLKRDKNETLTRLYSRSPIIIQNHLPRFHH